MSRIQDITTAWDVFGPRSLGCLVTWGVYFDNCLAWFVVANCLLHVIWWEYWRFVKNRILLVPSYWNLTSRSALQLFFCVIISEIPTSVFLLDEIRTHIFCSFLVTCVWLVMFVVMGALVARIRQAGASSMDVARLHTDDAVDGFMYWKMRLCSLYIYIYIFIYLFIYLFIFVLKVFM